MGFVSVLKGLSIVFPVVITLMAVMMLNEAINNFVLQKTCSPEGVPQDINRYICNNITIVDSANDILLTTTGLRSACAALSAWAFGLFRDMAGKSRMLMFIGAAAELLTAMAFFVSAVYWKSSAWIPTMTQSFVSGLFGSTIMELGANCILMHESTPEELPFRMQVFMSTNLFLILTGSTLTTMIITYFGYRWLFTVCIALNIISFLLVIILVKEKGSPTKTLQECLRGLKTVFRWRENFVVLWMMLVASPLTFAILINENLDAIQFYQQKLRFSMYQVTMFNSYKFLISIVGSMIVPIILRKAFDLHHLTIGIIVSIVNIGANVSSAFAETTLSLYLLAWLHFLRMGSFPLPNTVISTIVEHNEIGTYLGTAALVTIFIPFGVPRLYRLVFSYTEKGWIGAFYFVSAALFAINAVLYSVSYCMYVKPKDPEIKENEEDKNQKVENGNQRLPETTTEL